MTSSGHVLSFSSSMETSCDTKFTVFLLKSALSSCVTCWGCDECISLLAWWLQELCFRFSWSRYNFDFSWFPDLITSSCHFLFSYTHEQCWFPDLMTSSSPKLFLFTSRLKEWMLFGWRIQVQVTERCMGIRPAAVMSARLKNKQTNITQYTAIAQKWRHAHIDGR